MVFPSLALEKTESSQEAIKRCDSKEFKETRVASDDSTTPTSNDIQVEVRKGFEAVRPFDDVNINGNVLDVREDSEAALPLDKAIKRSDQKEFKETMVASDDSTARTSNDIQVEVRKGFGAVLPFDDVNVKGNVLEVREDSEAALPLDKAIERSDPKECKETRVASDDSTAPTSNDIQVEEREDFEAVLPFDYVNVNGNVLDVWDDSEAALSLDKAIERSDPKDFNVSMVASDDSTACTSNDIQVEEREDFEAVLPSDNVNFIGNVFDVWEDSEAALPLDTAIERSDPKEFNETRVASDDSAAPTSNDIQVEVRKDLKAVLPFDDDNDSEVREDVEVALPLNEAIERSDPKEFKETRVASNDSTACTSNDIQIKVREDFEVVLLFDDEHANGNVLEEKEDVEAALPLDEVIKGSYPKEFNETRIASDDSAAPMSNDIQVHIREDFEAVLLFDDVDVKSNGSEVRKDSEAALPLDEAVERSDPKEFKMTRIASDDSTVPTSNVIQVQAQEGFEAGLLFDDVNVNGNVFEVREYSEAALPLGNVNVTEDVLEDANVQVDKGCTAFVENEQNCMELEEALSELDTRMESVTKKKVYFQIPPHKNMTKMKGNNFFGKKAVCENTSSVKFLKAVDIKQGDIQKILGLREVSRPEIEKKSEVSVNKSEEKDMSNRSMAVDGKAPISLMVEDVYALIAEEEALDGKAPISLMVEDAYALIVEEALQVYALIPDEALQAYDMIADEASRSLLFFKFLAEGNFVFAPSKQEGKEANDQEEAGAGEALEEASHPLLFFKRPEEVFLNEGSALFTLSKHEGKEAKDQDEARAREAPDEKVKAKEVKEDAIHVKLFWPKESRAKKTWTEKRLKIKIIEETQAGKAQDDENVEEEDFF